MRPQNATREQIASSLREGKSDSAIARALRVDKARVRRIRAELGIPVHVVQVPTLVEKWAAYTRPVDGGHLEWTGERGSRSGTPTMRYREKSISPAAVAFRIRHGREPIGQVFAECGMRHCVAPDHVDDEAGRARVREQVRYLTGGPERKPLCVHGHDQAVHGRYKPDGTAYCEACKVVARRAQRHRARTDHARARS